MRTKSVKRLPDWLTLEKYAPVSTFDARQWLEQLRYRRHLLQGNPRFPGDTRDIADEEAFTQWVERRSAKIEELCGSPLVRSGPKSAFIVAGRPNATIMTDGDFSYSVPGLAPLRSVTIGDLVDQAQLDRSPLTARTNEPDKWGYFSLSDSSARIPPDVVDQPLLLGRKGNPVLTVDITAGDTDILEFFTAWLSKVRKAHNLRPVRRSEPKYLKWNGYGLLPYLDVKIWSMKSGEKPTDKVLAQFVADLSGDAAADAKRIGSVTASTAKELMSERSELLSELEALSILERDVRK